jgi:hypothetical protein
VLETALDAADTMEASNSFEKMLTHQLGLMHHLTMKMGAQAIRHVERLGQANLTHARRSGSRLRLPGSGTPPPG